MNQGTHLLYPATSDLLSYTQICPITQDKLAFNVMHLFIKYFQTLYIHCSFNTIQGSWRALLQKTEVKENKTSAISTTEYNIVEGMHKSRAGLQDLCQLNLNGDLSTVSFPLTL